MVSAAAFYELPSRLRLSESCFGKRFAIRVAGRAVTLVMPEILWSDDRPSVAAPTSRVLDQERLVHLAEARKDGWAKWHTWGSVDGWNPRKGVATDVWVGSVLLEFTLDPKSISYSDYMYGRGHPEGPQVDLMFASIDSWFDHLRTWIEVAVDQDADPEHPIRLIRVAGSGLQVVTVDDEATSLPASASKIDVFVGPSQEVNLATFRKVLAKVRATAAPSDAHLLIRSARADLRRDRYRKAVIDAGAAVELALADLNRRGPNVNTGTRPTLGWFVGQPLVAQAAALATTTRAELVDVRNAAIHQNIVPTSREAFRAVRQAKVIIDRLEPLGL